MGKNKMLVVNLGNAMWTKNRRIRTTIFHCRGSNVTANIYGKRNKTLHFIWSFIVNHRTKIIPHIQVLQGSSLE